MTPEGGKIGTHDDKYGDKNVTAGDKIDAVMRHSCARIPRYIKKIPGTILVAKTTRMTPNCRQECGLS